MFLPIFRDKRPLRWDLILEKNTTKSTFAKRTADIVGLDHHYKVISSDEFWGNSKNVQYHMDQPLADPSCIALYFVSKIASEHVKVVLSGEGADELFGGYDVYNEPLVFKTIVNFHKDCALG